jgi:predicted adenine nucleotide alpha hydrolase (AANH) superfamily ATPase
MSDIMNYDDEMMNTINLMKGTPKLLLHSCCAPCSSAVITRLSPYFDITIIYYNPNIDSKEEYEKRKQEQIRFISEFESVNKIDYLDCENDPSIFYEKVKGLENEPERGARCPVCFKLRLEKTAYEAKRLGYDYFATTLTVSPYKNSNQINEIGKFLETVYNVKYLASDFKKKDGYKLSIELSHKYKLYRQNYCGCVFSKRNCNDGK